MVWNEGNEATRTGCGKGWVLALCLDGAVETRSAVCARLQQGMRSSGCFYSLNTQRVPRERLLPRGFPEPGSASKAFFRAALRCSV